MSYDIRLEDPDTGEVAKATTTLPFHGGVYPVGGTDNLEFNITYNYAEILYTHLDEDLGIRWLYGKTGAEAMPRILEVISNLKSDKSDDYWEATEGNVRQALSAVLWMSIEAPNAIWRGD